MSGQNPRTTHIIEESVLIKNTGECFGGKPFFNGEGQFLYPELVPEWKLENPVPVILGDGQRIHSPAPSPPDPIPASSSQSSKINPFADPVLVVD